MEEVWKPAADYESFYEASNTGKIRRRFNRRKTALGYLIGIPSNCGYLRVCIHVENSRQIIRAIHRIVAKTFVPNLENKSEVNHKNGIKTDNRAENLEWVTRSENERHAYETGLAGVGSRNGQSKVTEEQVREIRKLQESGTTLRVIADRYHLSQSTVSSICRRQNWKHVK